MMRLKHGYRDGQTPVVSSREFSLFFSSYDQFVLKMTTCVARSKEPSLSKVQFVAILIRILDLIKYGHFL